MKVTYSKQARKFLREIPRSQAEIIENAINGIPSLNGDIRNMSGMANTYKLTKGGYQVVFTEKHGSFKIEKVERVMTLDREGKEILSRLISSEEYLQRMLNEVQGEIEVFCSRLSPNEAEEIEAIRNIEGEKTLEEFYLQDTIDNDK